ncbi:MAG: glucosidase [Myxococcales bacterium]|nr:glucosidase [Myxococcales bacterium]
MARSAEAIRLEEDCKRQKYWKRWGPYLSERQWGTVREDYSPDGECWHYFPHDHARSRAYRWGEDGLLGICDSRARLCFALALWNGRDPILKERLFGLTGPEGNHGEDVKELYYYLDGTPTGSYLKALYKYPQAEFPYQKLVDGNAARGYHDRELELLDTGVLEGGRYFDVFAEYAKATPDDVLIRITVVNHGPEAAPLTVLPTLWFRNTWSWGRTGEGYTGRPTIVGQSSSLLANHEVLGSYRLAAEPPPGRESATFLFTENETNRERLYGEGDGLYKKDAFHDYVVRGETGAIKPVSRGTKAAACYQLTVPPGGQEVIRLRLFRPSDAPEAPFGASFAATFAQRIIEADAYYAEAHPEALAAEEERICRQASAGLLWTKQFYYYVVKEWQEGDPVNPPPAPGRAAIRNADWAHLFNRDVVSMPDKWEYPWFAAWDLAFHLIPFARIDPYFAKSQTVLFLREWFMHPNGQMPAYEFNFSDVNPPVHAWAAWRIYKMAAHHTGERDRLFLARVFHKLVLNFTWWVNRKDAEGNNLFSGGFLGLDNIGVFDRSKPLPTGGHLAQADGTAWMAFYCATMLGIALELAQDDPAIEDMASKFFEHFIAITDAVKTVGGSGLWDETDGFFYDALVKENGERIPLRIRSMVGLIPLFAGIVLEDAAIEHLPGFKRRMDWLLENRQDLARHITWRQHDNNHRHRLLAIPTRSQLESVLRYVLDPNEFLSPYGVRSLSRYHLEHPYSFKADGNEWRVAYVPAESDSGLFGGNSNWRGPIWLPVNYLLIEALQRYHHFYGDDFTVECPVGSGRKMNLAGVAQELSRRLVSIFMPDSEGRRPCHGDDHIYANDPSWRELVLFYEYFDGDTGRGVGASHQTGWTALASSIIQRMARDRERL